MGAKIKMKICDVCKVNPVKIRGCVTCSIECATKLDNEVARHQNRPSDTWETIGKRIPNDWKQANPGLML